MPSVSVGSGEGSAVGEGLIVGDASTGGEGVAETGEAWAAGRVVEAAEAGEKADRVAVYIGVGDSGVWVAVGVTLVEVSVGEAVGVADCAAVSDGETVEEAVTFGDEVGVCGLSTVVVTIERASPTITKVDPKAKTVERGRHQAATALGRRSPAAVKNLARLCICAGRGTRLTRKVA